MAPALTATGDAAKTERGTRIVSAQEVGWTVRRLTPRECERLQGFPDDWTKIAGASDSQRYRVIGNSVAVPVLEWIGRRLKAWEELEARNIDQANGRGHRGLHGEATAR